MDSGSGEPTTGSVTVRRLAIGTSLLVVLPVLVYGIFVLIAWRSDPKLGGDLALLEMWTRSAAQGDASLGPYSRFVWNHPGPSVFYWFAPFYFASGQAIGGLGVAAVAMVVTSLVASVICVVRQRGTVGAVAMVLVGAWFHVSLGTDWYDNMWNPVMIVVPTILVGLAAAACHAGSPRWILVVAVAGTFAVQTHLGAVPVVACFAGLAAVAAVRGLRNDGRAWRRPAGAAVVVLLLMWALPLYEQSTRDPGNVSQLLETRAVTSGGSRSLQDVLDVVVVQATLGDTHLMTDALDQLELPVASWWRIAWLLLLVGAVAGASWRARTAHRRFEAGLGAASIVALGTLIASLIGVEGELQPYVTLSALSVGFLMHLVLVLEFSIEFRRFVSRRVPPDRRRQQLQAVGALAGVVALAATSLVLLQQSYRNVVAERPGIANSDGAVDRIAGELDSSARVLITIPDFERWVEAVVVANELERRGIATAGTEEFLFMFGDQRTPTGCETHTLIVTSRSRGDSSTSVAESTDPMAVEGGPIPIGSAHMAVTPREIPERCTG